MLAENYFFKRSKKERLSLASTAARKSGQVLIEIVLTIAVASIVLVALTTGMITSREAFARSEKRQTASFLLQRQVEAVRSVRESGWDNLSNGTYHLRNGPEYKIRVCLQSNPGCPPPSPLDEVISSSNGVGEVSAPLNYPPQFVVNIRVTKLTGCSPECPETSTIKSMLLAELTPNAGMTVYICPSSGCPAIASFTGTTNSAGELTATFSYAEDEVLFIVFRSPATGCSGWECLEAPTVKNITLSGLEPGTGWSLSPGPIEISGFTRQIVIEDVCRKEPTSKPTNCANPQASIDSSIKKITATISWSFLGTPTVSSTFYLTRYIDNAAWTQTTQAEFDLGTKINTVTTNINGGEVQLEPLGGPATSWDNPQRTAGYNLPGTANDIFVANNRAYVARGSQLYIFDVTDPTNPIPLNDPPPAWPLTINSIYVSGNYAYLATTNDFELIIIDVSNPTDMVLKGAYNLPGNQDANGVYVSSNRVFIVRDKVPTGPEFYHLNVDLIPPFASISVGASIELGDSGNDVFALTTDIVYVASSNNNQELQLIYIPYGSVFRTFDAPGNFDGLSVYGSGLYVYLTTKKTNSSNFYVSYFGNPLGSTNTGGNATDVFVSGNLAFLTTTAAGAGFQIFDVSNPASPTKLSPGEADISGSGFGVYTIGDYAYLATDNPSLEFQIYTKGSVGGGGYVTSGSFESQTFDCSVPTPPATQICNGNKAGYNYLTWNASEPAGTNIQFQIAANSDGSTWTFVGPDGTVSSFYETPAAIPLNFADAQYLKFKAFLSGDGSATPVLEDVTVNYSP